MTDYYTKFLKLAKELCVEDENKLKWVTDRVSEAEQKDERRRAEEARIRKEEREAEDKRREEERSHEIRLAELKTKGEDKVKELGNRKLPNFNDKIDEIDSYLHRFELHATNVGWPKQKWSMHLQTSLTGKCLKVLETLSVEDAGDYDTLKKSLLNAFQCNSEGFRNKFKSCKPEKDETFSTYLSRQGKLLERWLELSDVDKNKPEEIIDLIRRDQVYTTCHPELVAHLKESQPKSCAEMEKLGCHFQMAHPNINLAKSREEHCYYGQQIDSVDRARSKFRKDFQDRRAHSTPPRNDRQGHGSYPKVCTGCGKRGHFVQHCWHRNSQNVGQEESDDQVKVCYICHKKGHISFQCPEKKTKTYRNSGQKSGSDQNNVKQQSR